MPPRLPILALVLGATTLGGGAAAAQDVMFQDMLGNDITLDRPAERIITIPNPTPGTVITVAGEVAPLVGANPTSILALVDSIMGEIFPEAADINGDIIGLGGGFAPNVEEIASLLPDVVIQWGDRGSEIIDPLTNAGLNVALYIDGEEEEAALTNTMLAGMLNVPERAEQFNAWRAEVHADIVARVALIPEDERKSVIQLTLRPDGGSYSTGGLRHIALIGADNPAAEAGGTTINYEQVVLWDPDIILVHPYNASTPDLVYDNPILSATRAAQNDQIYVSPIGSTMWGNTLTSDDPLFWMWLGELIYPEYFDYDLRAEVADAFEMFFGYRLSETQIDRILQVERNSGSAYVMFAAVP